MKATSIFGGVQVFNILISVIRSKFIAILLGPAGMGISGLLLSTTGLINSLTNFGLGISAVRDIARANETDDPKKISRVVSVFRKLVWITGLLGMAVTLILSPYLSEITFGNKDYTIGFMLLSCTLLFTQFISGQDVLLQGMRKISELAKANLLGSLFGLLTSIPLYYVYGIKGIIPAIIISTIITFIITWYFARSLKVEKVSVTIKQSLEEVPLNMALVESYVQKADAVVTDVCAKAEDMIENALLVERIIQYGNRYRASHPQVHDKLLKAEASFMQCRYLRALEEAGTAVEEVEPGALKKIQGMIQVKA